MADQSVKAHHHNFSRGSFPFHYELLYQLQQKQTQPKHPQKQRYQEEEEEEKIEEKEVEHPTIKKRSYSTSQLNLHFQDDQQQKQIWLQRLGLTSKSVRPLPSSTASTVSIPMISATNCSQTTSTTFTCSLQNLLSFSTSSLLPSRLIRGNDDNQSLMNSAWPNQYSRAVLYNENNNIPESSLLIDAHLAVLRMPSFACCQHLYLLGISITSPWILAGAVNPSNLPQLRSLHILAISPISTAVIATILQSAKLLSAVSIAGWSDMSDGFCRDLVAYSYQIAAVHLQSEVDLFFPWKLPLPEITDEIWWTVLLKQPQLEYWNGTLVPSDQRYEAYKHYCQTMRNQQHRSQYQYHFTTQNQQFQQPQQLQWWINGKDVDNLRESVSAALWNHSIVSQSKHLQSSCWPSNQLVFLDLSHQHLINLHLNLLPQAIQVQVLLLNHNHITSLRDTECEYLTSLHTLDLSNNEIASLSDCMELAHIPSLHHLDIRANPCMEAVEARSYIIYLCHWNRGSGIIPGLQELDGKSVIAAEYRNSIQMFDLQASEKLDQLDWFQQLQQWSTQQSKGSMSRMFSSALSLRYVNVQTLTSLSTLDLSWNNLIKVVGLEEVIHLRVLDLSHNPRLNIAYTITQLLMLQQLCRIDLTKAPVQEDDAAEDNDSESRADLPNDSAIESYAANVSSILHQLFPRHERLHSINGIRLQQHHYVTAMKHHLENHLYLLLEHDGEEDIELQKMKWLSQYQLNLRLTYDLIPESNRCYGYEATQRYVNDHVLNIIHAHLSNSNFQDVFIFPHMFHHIQFIDLSHNFLTSTFFLHATSFPKLEYLDLGYNHLNCSAIQLAAWISRLHNLRGIILKGNPCITKHHRYDQAFRRKIIQHTTSMINVHCCLTVIDTEITLSERMIAAEYQLGDNVASLKSVSTLSEERDHRVYETATNKKRTALILNSLERKFLPQDIEQLRFALTLQYVLLVSSREAVDMKCESLTSLNLNNCNLSCIWFKLYRLPVLTHLFLGNNCLTTITGSETGLHSLHHLETLELHENLLVDLEELLSLIKLLPRLLRLTLRGNRFKSTQKLYRHQLALLAIMNHTSLSYIDDQLISSEEWMIAIYYSKQYSGSESETSSKKRSEKFKEEFTGSGGFDQSAPIFGHSVHWLEEQMNSFEAVVEKLSDGHNQAPQNMSHFDISNLGLHTMSFHRFSLLAYLNISGNQITNQQLSDSGLCHCQQLEWLDISKNQLNSFPLTVYPIQLLHSLQNICFLDNPMITTDVSLPKIMFLSYHPHLLDLSFGLIFINGEKIQISDRLDACLIEIRRHHRQLDEYQTEYDSCSSPHSGLIIQPESWRLMITKHSRRRGVISPIGNNINLSPSGSNFLAADETRSHPGRRFSFRKRVNSLAMLTKFFGLSISTSNEHFNEKGDSPSHHSQSLNDSQEIKFREPFSSTSISTCLFPVLPSPFLVTHDYHLSNDIYYTIEIARWKLSIAAYLVNDKREGSNASMGAHYSGNEIISNDQVCSTLTHLRLISCRLMCVEAQRFPALTVLDLRNNRLHTLQQQGFDSLLLLEHLDLRDNDLLSLENSLAVLQSCDALTSLSLMNSTRDKAETSITANYQSVVFKTLRGIIICDEQENFSHIRASDNCCSALFFLHHLIGLGPNQVSEGFEADFSDRGYPIWMWRYILAALYELQIGCVRLNGNNEWCKLEHYHDIVIVCLGRHLRILDGIKITEERRYFALQMNKKKKLDSQRINWSSVHNVERIIDRYEQTSQLPDHYDLSIMEQKSDLFTAGVSPSSKKSTIPVSRVLATEKEDEQPQSYNPSVPQGLLSNSASASSSNSTVTSTQKISSSLNNVLNQCEIAAHAVQMYVATISGNIGLVFPSNLTDLSVWIKVAALDLSDFFRVNVTASRNILFVVLITLPIILWLLFCWFASLRTHQQFYVKKFITDWKRTCLIHFICYLLGLIICILISLFGVNNNNDYLSSISLIIMLLLISIWSLIFALMFLLARIFRSEYLQDMTPDRFQFQSKWMKVVNWAQIIVLSLLTIMYAPTTRLVLSELECVCTVDSQGNNLCSAADSEQACFPISITVTQYISLVAALFCVIGLPTIYFKLVKKTVKVILGTNSGYEQIQNKLHLLNEELKQAESILHLQQREQNRLKKKKQKSFRFKTFRRSSLSPIKRPELHLEDTTLLTSITNLREICIDLQRNIRTLDSQLDALFCNIVNQEENSIPVASLFNGFTRHHQLWKIYQMILQLIILTIQLFVPATLGKISHANNLANAIVMTISFVSVLIAHPFQNKLDNLMNAMTGLANSTNSIVVLGLAEEWSWLQGDISQILLILANIAIVCAVIIAFVIIPIKAYKQYAAKQLEAKGADSEDIPVNSSQPSPVDMGLIESSTNSSNARVRVNGSTLIQVRQPNGFSRNFCGESQAETFRNRIRSLNFPLQSTTEKDRILNAANKQTIGHSLRRFSVLDSRIKVRQLPIRAIRASPKMLSELGA